MGKESVGKSGAGWITAPDGTMWSKFPQKINHKDYTSGLNNLVNLLYGAMLKDILTDPDTVCTTMEVDTHGRTDGSLVDVTIDWYSKGSEALVRTGNFYLINNIRRSSLINLVFSCI